MIAKRLETLMAQAAGRSEAEMVQRFQNGREFGLLPRSRGRNAEDLSIREVVGAILLAVSENTTQSGLMSTILQGLLPVGGVDASFMRADTFGAAIETFFAKPEAIEAVREVRVSANEIYRNSHGRAAIIYADGDQEKTAYYVRREAVSLLQPGADKTYEPRALITSSINETVLFPGFFKRIARELAAIPNVTPSGLTSEAFRSALQSLLNEARERQSPYIDISAGELHRALGGYPGPTHRMPICCSIMRDAMQPDDMLLAAPPSGQGASLIIRYKLPRKGG